MKNILVQKFFNFSLFTAYIISFFTFFCQNNLAQNTKILIKINDNIITSNDLIDRVKFIEIINNITINIKQYNDILRIMIREKILSQFYVTHTNYSYNKASYFFLGYLSMYTSLMLQLLVTNNVFKLLF